MKNWSSIVDRITKLLYIKKKYSFLKRHIYIYKPTSFYFSKNSSVNIEKSFIFNVHWDNHRICRNKMLGSLYVLDNSNLSIGDFLCYPGCRITVNPNARLSIKSGYMNFESVIECFDSIEIGEGVIISERVVIRDSNNHFIDYAGYTCTSPIKICDHVWIGVGATILPGVTVGEGSVIAAGSLVTKDVPNNVVVAGTPARVIKENILWK